MPASDELLFTLTSEPSVEVDGRKPAGIVPGAELVLLSPLNSVPVPGDVLFVLASELPVEIDGGNPAGSVPELELVLFSLLVAAPVPVSDELLFTLTSDPPLEVDGGKPAGNVPGEFEVLFPSTCESPVELGVDDAEGAVDVAFPPVSLPFSTALLLSLSLEDSSNWPWSLLVSLLKGDLGNAYAEETEA